MGQVVPETKDAKLNKPIAVKVCSHCHVEKPTTEFSRRKASKDGLSYTCKVCERKTAMDSYTRKKKAKKRKKYYADNREKILQACKESYERNKKQRLATCRKYRINHPDVFRKAGEIRRKRLRAVPRDYTREEIIEASRVEGVPICAICSKPIRKANEIHIDHIRPLAQNGPDTKDNVRVTHKRCNLTRPKDGRDLKEAKQ